LIVLIGFMGAGKTTVGRLLAHRLGIPFVDTDEEIESRSRTTIARIFEGEGEEAFRRLERTVVAEALARSDPAVIALGGGALSDPDTLAVLGDATVVHLDVSVEEALRRVGDVAARPMLERVEPRALYLERARIYDSAADMRVATDGLTPETVATELAAALGDGTPEAERPAVDSLPRIAASAGDHVQRIAVRAPGGFYEVAVGTDIAASAAQFVPHVGDYEKAFIVTHPSLARLAEAPLGSLHAAGLDVDIAFAPEGESSKSLDVASALFDWLGRSRAHRSDLVVAVGGGVVCDLAGFVASTYARGLAVAHVPTTLLAQVDAAVGGKTGVNLPHGKNLVGTFHQPVAVICDVGLLGSLPVEELRSGMAEVVKYGLIAEPKLLETVEAHAGSLLAADASPLVDVVERSVSIKAAYVTDDERDRGIREHLNYGHTFAHAIEATAGAQWGEIRHGEAVALGMMAAAHLAEDLGRLTPEDVAAHRRALEAAGLPVEARLDVAALEAAWEVDKKYRRGVRFVLLNGIGKPEAGVMVPRAALDRSLERLAG
jgi:shikimate kinase / 3-dehydroquinate synthase